MLDHVSITVEDLEPAEIFYDAVMEALGIAKVGRSDAWIGYGERSSGDHPDRVYLSIRVETGQPRSGRHWAFRASDRARVDGFWSAGLAAGGDDEGAPGLRQEYHPTYYAAFLRDPSGNLIEAVCHRS